MIVSFSVSNFRSFFSEETFSLVASSRLNGTHDNHAISIPDSDQKVLRFGVLYGANGAGKSNLFKALDYLRSLAIRPREKGKGTGREAFRLGGSLEGASSFDLQFIASKKLYRFGVKVDDQRIIEEWLVHVKGDREQIIYERTTDDEGNVKIDGPGLPKADEKLKALTVVGGPKNQTFLATAIANLKTSDYGEHISAVFRWFGPQLNLIAPDAHFGPLGDYYLENPKSSDFASQFLRSVSTGVEKLIVTKNEISEEELRRLLPESIYKQLMESLPEDQDEMAIIQRNGSSFELQVEKTGDKQKHFYRVSIGMDHQSAKGEPITFDLTDESDGTQRLLDLIPALCGLETANQCFFIDEIDRSLHPILVREFISFFLRTNCDAHVQMIVTTHESSLLDLDLLRRDEIWFAEKDNNSATRLYALTDFKVRKDLEIRKHYLSGRFGAIPFLGNLDRLIEEKC
jgi:AAA15 family ATPase/GTPase